MFIATLAKYVIKHKIAIIYHPHISGQAELFNIETKRIFKKIENYTRRDLSTRIDDFLWAYKITYKTPLSMTPHRIIYDKACHLPLELECKAY